MTAGNNTTRAMPNPILHRGICSSQHAVGKKANLKLGCNYYYPDPKIPTSFIHPDVVQNHPDVIQDSYLFGEIFQWFWVSSCVSLCRPKLFCSGGAELHETE